MKEISWRERQIVEQIADIPRVKIELDQRAVEHARAQEERDSAELMREIDEIFREQGEEPISERMDGDSLSPAIGDSDEQGVAAEAVSTSGVPGTTALSSASAGIPPGRARGSKRVAGSYAFPDLSTAPLEPNECRCELEDINRQHRDGADYPSVRERFCKLAIALNLNGKWAPAFRPQPRLSPLKKRDPGGLLLHRDRLVIDAHWLWARRETGVAIVAKEYGALLEGDVFDFRLASFYAAEGWTSAYRVEQWGLADAIQWQLSVTQDAAHIEARRALQDGVRVPGAARTAALTAPVRKALGEWAHMRPAIGREGPVYLALWAAREMLGPAATLDAVAQLAGFITGRPALHKTTARHKLAALDQRLTAGTKTGGGRS